MHTRWKWLAVIASVTLALAICYVVDEGQVAIITQFGRPVAVVRAAGLHFKWPWQIRMTLDARLQSFNPPASELLTRDKKNLVIDSFVMWRVGDPQRFVQAVVDRPGAESRL